MSPSKAPQLPASPGRLGPGRAVILGQVFVNVPAMILIVAGSWIGQNLLPSLVWVILVAGFLCAWIWYAFAISRWRKWAVRQVTDTARLQRLAEITGLLWPKGSPYEKKEFRDRK